MKGFWGPVKSAKTGTNSMKSSFEKPLVFGLGVIVKFSTELSLHISGKS